MFNYIDKIQQIALDNKYTKWYCSLIKSRLQKQQTGYTEKHHILPRCFKLGGERDKENIVILTTREHFIAHWLLTKMFKDLNKQKMHLAFAAMSRDKNKRKLSQYEYEISRKFNSMCKIGIKKSEETKRKMSACKIGSKGRKGQPLTQNHKEKIRLSKIGTKFSTEAKNKMSISAKGNKNTKNTIWINNGMIRKMINNTSEIPDGWIKGKSISIQQTSLFPQALLNNLLADQVQL